jgi:peroxiredoxin
VTEERPGFTHKRERHGLIGPFSGRQLLAAAVAILVVAIIGIAITTPLGNTSIGPNMVNPQATPFIIGEAPAQGLRAGETAPELASVLGDGSTYQLTDLDGKPVRLADLRGKAVWINFWASWCPPCQSETPVIRDVAQRYKDQGLVVIGISVQETNAADVRAYAERYQLGYTIAADLTGEIFRLYRPPGLPTQIFIGTDGAIRSVVLAPLSEAGAEAQVQAILPR